MPATTDNSKRSEIADKLEAARLRREELELTKLEDEIAKIEAAKARLSSIREQAEKDLRDFKQRALDRQENCNHRKGGMDLEGINGNGSHAHHCVAKHQLPHGHLMVLCMRCLKQWLPGDEGYREMARAQTDNVTSTSVQFSGVTSIPDVHQFQDSADKKK